ENFAAYADRDRILSGEDAFRRRHDGQTEAAEHARDLLLVAVDAAARTRDPLDPVDDRLAVFRVLEIDAENRLRLLFIDLEVPDETLALQDWGRLDFGFR